MAEAGLGGRNGFGWPKRVRVTVKCLGDHRVTRTSPEHTWVTRTHLGHPKIPYTTMVMASGMTRKVIEVARPT